MMKISLFNLVIALSLSAVAQKASAPASLGQVRDLIAAKKTAEAVAVLKTEHRRLLRTEKDFKDITQWLSIFLYENSMELYEKAEELSPTDASGATEQFEALLEKEPFNKVAMSSFIAFLIEQKKFSAASALIEKSITDLPYFPVFSVYKSWMAQVQGEKSAVVVCDKKAMTAVEQEMCWLTHLVAKVQASDAKKKPSEQELKNLAGKSTIPDAQYWLWLGTKNENYLKRYVSLCRGLTEKYKKNYRIVPGLCAKMLESESQLEPKQNDEANTP